MNILKEGINTGVIINEPRATDYVAGGVSPIVFSVRVKDGQWEKYRPNPESQIGTYFDTMSCVSFAADQTIAEQVDYLVASLTLSVDQVAALQALGFFDTNGKFNASDRFTAIMSGTTQNGNSLVTVWDSIRTNGLLPQTDLPNFLDNHGPWTFNDWINPANVTQAMKDKAKKIFDILQFAYEWVPTDRETMKHHLQQAPLQIAAPVCSPWNTTDIIKTCAGGAGHSTVIDGYVDGKELEDFDHYDPYGKRLAWDYNIPWALKGIVAAQQTNLVTKNPMIIYKQAGQSALYVSVGNILIPFNTDFPTYQADFAAAKIIELPASEFVKLTVSTKVQITKK